MVRIYQAMNERNMRSKMILQVHDELIFDTCPDELETLSALVREHMSGAMQLSVPLDVNINSGSNWLEAH
jgi:DNA polymerase-1